MSDLSGLGGATKRDPLAGLGGTKNSDPLAGLGGSKGSLSGLGGRSGSLSGLSSGGTSGGAQPDPIIIGNNNKPASKGGGKFDFLNTIGKALGVGNIGKAGDHSGATGALRDWLSFVNPANTGKIVKDIGSAAWHDAGNLARAVPANVESVAKGDPLGSHLDERLPADLRLHPGEDRLTHLQRAFPLTGGMAKAAQKTGAYAAGAAQDLGAPGHGFADQTTKDFTSNPFGSTMNVVGTAALLGGPVGRLLGAGGDALAGTARAEELAAEAEAHATAVGNAAARGVASPAAAAQTAQEASALRAMADRAAANPVSRLGGVVEQGGHLAGKGLGIPFAPFRSVLLGDLAPVIGERLAGRLPGEGKFNGVKQAFEGIGKVGTAATEEARNTALAEHPVAGQLAGFPIPHTPRGPATIGEALGNYAQDRAMREFTRENVETPTRQGQADIAKNLSDAREAVAGKGGLFGRKSVPDAEAEHAVNLGQAGIGGIVKALSGRPGGERVFKELGISPRVADLVEHPTGGMTTADQIRSPQIESRQADALDGRGRVKGPLNPEQVGNKPLSSPVDAATVDTDLAAHNAQMAARSARGFAGLPQEPPIPGALPASQARIPAIELAVRQLARPDSLGPTAYQDLAQLAFDHGLQSPEQLPEYLAQLRQSMGKVNPSLASGAIKAARVAADAAEKARQDAVDNPMNAPARHRPALMAGQQAYESAHRIADEMDAKLPGSGNLLRQGAEDIPRTLEKMVAAGIDPKHLIGPGRDFGPLTNRSTPSLPRVKQLGTEHMKTSGAIPKDFGEVAKTDLANEARIVANESAPRFQERFGTTAAQAGFTGPDFREQIRAAKLTPWNPKAWTETVPFDKINPDTPLIPTRLFEQYKTYFSPPKPGTAASIYDSLIRGTKNIGVALNPAYHAGVIFGDALKATAGGGVNPARLGARMLDAIDLMKNEPNDPRVVGLAGKGMSAEMADQLTGREQPRPGITGRLAAPAWKASGWVQSVQRIALALAKEDQGMSTRAAIRESLKVLGDFEHMTPLEQNAFRRIVPGYAFYKAITTLALHLPLEAPERIGWLNYLHNAAGASNTSDTPQFLDPMHMFGTIPSLAVPIRAGAEGLGFKVGPNLARERMLTEPAKVGADGQPLPKGSPLLRGRTGLTEASYLARQLFPQGKVFDALTSNNVKRFDTGEPVRDKRSPLPGHEVAYPTHPGLDKAGVPDRVQAALQALGLIPQTKTVNTPVQQKRIDRYNKSQTKAARLYERLGSFKGR